MRIKYKWVPEREVWGITPLLGRCSLGGFQRIGAPGQSAAGNGARSSPPNPTHREVKPIGWTSQQPSQERPENSANSQHQTKHGSTPKPAIWRLRGSAMWPLPRRHANGKRRRKRIGEHLPFRDSFVPEARQRLEQPPCDQPVNRRQGDTQHAGRFGD